MTEPLQNPPSEVPTTGGRLVATSSALAKRAPYGAVGTYGPAMPEESDEFSLDLVEYLRILNKRKWLIAGVAVAFLALGALVTFMMTPHYKATVRLQIDRQAAKIVEGGNVTPLDAGFDTDFLKTQYELLQSRSMAERVVSMLKLGENPTFMASEKHSILSGLSTLFGSQPQSSESVSEKADDQRGAAEIISKNLTVEPVRGSRLVDVSYSDPDPHWAQRIIAAYADAFIAANLDKRFEANAYAKTFLEDQIKQLKLRLEDSEKALLEFAQKEQIVAVADKTSMAESNLAAANEALGNLVSERIKNEEIWKQAAPADATNLPQVLSNKTIETLRTTRNELASDYQEKLDTFKPDYPEMTQIRNKIAEIDRQFASEVGAIRQSLKAGYENSLSQEEEMKKRVEQLRADVLYFQKRSIQYNILKREVDTNRSLYEGLLQRYKEVDVAGGAGANNVFIVDKAALPEFPSSPRIPLNLALSLAFGLGAGIAAAFLLEYVDDTFSSAEDVERLLGLATLGIIPKVDSEQAVTAELSEPRSAMSEAYRSLCTALQFSTERGLPRTLAITSTGTSEGKSITALAIARHFSTMGLKVLLVDSDLRKPTLHAKLGLDNAFGLSNYLTGACAPPEAFQKTAMPKLAFMASGPVPPNAADLLASPRLLSLLSIGSEVFDLIVLDGPPVMGIADALLLSNAVEATIFVVAANQARSGPVIESMRRLAHARGALIGTVLTKYDAKAAGYGYG
ncbi:MAG: GumC family protein, partial [Terriglobia bacterium]